jgi:small subunit ribosomal protein S21
MLIIPVKEGESIEKALKKFKRKVEKTGLIKQLRERTIDCSSRRNKARYLQQYI